MSNAAGTCRVRDGDRATQVPAIFLRKKPLRYATFGHGVMAIRLLVSSSALYTDFPALSEILLHERADIMSDMMY